jgi:hypothetical protein
MDKEIKETLLVSFFYPLGNHHTVLICGASVIKQNIEECLKEGLTIKDIKIKLFEMLNSVDQLGARAWKASQSADKLKQILDKLIPVTGSN